MSVSWSAFMAGEWNLQIDSSLRDRVYAMRVIRKSNGGSQTYHATVLTESIDYCPFAKRDKIVVPNQVVDICKEMIYNFSDFWNDGAEERNG